MTGATSCTGTESAPGSDSKRTLALLARSQAQNSAQLEIMKKELDKQKQRSKKEAQNSRALEKQLRQTVMDVESRGENDAEAMSKALTKKRKAEEVSWICGVQASFAHVGNPLQFNS